MIGGEKHGQEHFYDALGNCTVYNVMYWKFGHKKTRTGGLWRHTHGQHRTYLGWKKIKKRGAKLHVCIAMYVYASLCCTSRRDSTMTVRYWMCASSGRQQQQRLALAPRLYSPPCVATSQGLHHEPVRNVACVHAQFEHWTSSPNCMTPQTSKLLWDGLLPPS